MQACKCENGKNKVKLDNNSNKILFSCLNIKECQNHSLLIGKTSLKVAYRKQVWNQAVLQLQGKIKCNKSSDSEKAFAVFRNTTVSKNICKHCCKMVCNVMKVELLKTSPKRQSQIVRKASLFMLEVMFLKLSFHITGREPASYCYCTSKD